MIRKPNVPTPFPVLDQEGSPVYPPQEITRATPFVELLRNAYDHGASDYVSAPAVFDDPGDSPDLEADIRTNRFDRMAPQTAKSLVPEADQLNDLRKQFDTAASIHADSLESTPSPASED